MKSSVGNRILMLIENSGYPLDPRVRLEAETLVTAGYQVSVICQRFRKESLRQVINNVSVFRYPASPQAQNFLGFVIEYSYSFLATFFLSLIVCVYRGFDIIHAANPPDTAVFIGMFYRLFGKRFVFDHHDLAPEMYLVRSKNKGSQIIYRLLSWMERLSFHFADHVISTNQSYKNRAITCGHVSEKRITIVRNGPLLETLKLLDPAPDIRKRGNVIIGFVGVIAPQDGVDYLIRAIHQLITVLHRTDFFCIIIGDGSGLADLKSLATQLGINSYVMFTGFIPFSDMPKYFSSMDIGVDPDPSNRYNDCSTMIKMMEYMSYSLPIVAFDLPEHRVTAGQAALYALPNDELDFARQIQALMDDPDRRKKMGLIGRERVECELAWPYQARHLLDAYQSLTKNPRKVRAHLS